MKPKRKLGPRWPALVVGLVAACCAGLLVAALYGPHLARRVPYLGSVLGAVAHWLPAQVAWLHDPGTPALRSGAYLGWSDGVQGELHLYGAGCSATEGAAGGALTYFALHGPDGTLEVPPSAVTQLWTELDHVRSHPHLHVEVVTDRTLRFDRATLRCRDGQEARARVRATVLHVAAQHLDWPVAAAPLMVAPVPVGPVPLATTTEARAVVNGPSSLPDVGQVAEFTLAPAYEPLSVVSIRYAPARSATGVVEAAAGNPAALPYWRRQALAPYAPPPPAADLPPLTPWHSGYQLPDDPNALGPRQAASLGLTVAPDEVGIIYLLPTSFRPTPAPRPLLLKPVLEVEHAGHRGLVVPAGLAFGWTVPP